MPGVDRLGWRHGLIDSVKEARSFGVNQVVIFPKVCLPRPQQSVPFYYFGGSFAIVMSLHYDLLSPLHCGTSVVANNTLMLFQINTMHQLSWSGSFGMVELRCVCLCKTRLLSVLFFTLVLRLTLHHNMVH